jgi:hypothetical protein
MKSVPGLALLAFVLAAAACDKAPSPTSPSGTFASGPVQIETFTGTMNQFSFRFYSFTVSNPGTVYVTLTSLRAGGSPTDITVSLAIGVPGGTDCLSEFATTAPARSAPQISGFVVPGVYCARIGDSGNVTQPVDFQINIAYPR